MDARLVAILTSAALAACSSAPAPAPDPDSPPAAATADGAAADGGTPAAAAAAGTSEWELAIWNDPRFRRRLAESYIAETEVEPRLTTVDRKTMEAVMDLIAADKPDEAIALLREHTGEGRCAVFDFTLATVQFGKERLDEAAAACRTAVEKYPKFRRAWRSLGIIEVRLGDHAAAARALARVIELGGGDAITWGLLAFAHANVENHLAAEHAYRTAHLLDPGTLDWQMGMARSFFKQKRFAEAAALCSQLIAAHPDRADLWLLQANAFLGLGQPMKAAENYEIVDRLGKATPDSLRMLGDIYVNEGLHDLAVAAHVRALTMDRDGDAQRAIRAAKALAASNAPAATQQLLQEIEALHGERLAAADRKDVLKLQARLAVAQEVTAEAAPGEARGSGSEAARLLEQIVALDPLDGEALILLGQHHGRAGDTEKAILYFERAANIEAFEADAKVRHAQLLAGQGKYAEALPLLRRAQSLKPRDNIQNYLEQVERVAQARK